MLSIPNQANQDQQLNPNDLPHTWKKEGGEGLSHPDSKGPTTSLPRVDISGLEVSALDTLSLPCYAVYGPHEHYIHCKCALRLFAISLNRALGAWPNLVVNSDAYSRFNQNYLYQKNKAVLALDKYLLIA